MAVAWASQGTVGIGSTSVTPGLPGSLANGDMVVIQVVAKQSASAILPTVTGWTKFFDQMGGTGTFGNGTGPTRLALFYREKDASWSTMPAVAVTNGNSSAAIAYRFTKAAGTVWVEPTVLYNEIGGTWGSGGGGTYGFVPAVAAGDMTVIAWSQMDDAPLVSSWKVEDGSNTGLVYANPTVRSGVVETTTGNDVGGGYTTQNVIASPTSHATPSWAFSASITGTMAWVRLREAAAGPATQTLTPTGFDDGSAVGSPTVVKMLTVVDAPNSPASAEAFGNPTIGTVITMAPSAIASGEALGSPVLAQVVPSQSLAPVGIADPTAFGTALVSTQVTISPTGIADPTAFGVTALLSKLTLSPTGIGTSESHGAPTLQPRITMFPAGIADPTAFGNPSLAMLVQMIAAGIASGEAFGLPSAAAIIPSVLLSPVAIASGEAWGGTEQKFVTSYADSGGTASGPPGEDIGKLFDGSAGTKWLRFWSSGPPVVASWTFASPTVLTEYNWYTGNDSAGRDPKNWTIEGSNNGIDWTVVDTVVDDPLQGARNFLKPGYTIDAPGAYSQYRWVITENWGDSSCVQVSELLLYGISNPVVSTVVTVQPIALASGEALGSPILVSLAGAQSLSPSAIASAEALGNPSMAALITLVAQGIASGQAFGNPISSTILTLVANGIISGESFGVPNANTALNTAPVSIVSSEGIGNPALLGKVSLSPTAIASSEAFGVAALLSKLTLSPTGVASSESMGAPSVFPVIALSPSGVATAAAFGTPTVGSRIVLSPTGFSDASAVGTPSLLSVVSVSPAGIITAQAVGNPTALGKVTLVPVGIVSQEDIGDQFIGMIREFVGWGLPIGINGVI